MLLQLGVGFVLALQQTIDVRGSCGIDVLVFEGVAVACVCGVEMTDF